ncbi:GNAT family N-acetyltransferase [Bdellovibrio sp. NC01]|uniref:GNAT family N-acetyltransferase n=1 Tax=Bdellovibrio sp. NC01 TaxID=2220073 RepID=UPI00115AE42A|nr:GNAT family N-acetyltransferase [Bdellovibrio sp. NC01]QDK38458.1 GNAT family N-acetyltransferase [Bdellovibrio sp. NC01]
MEFTFTHAKLSDVDAIVELVNSAYRGENAKQGWTTEADLLGGQRTDRDGILADIQRERSTILVAKDANQKILGCVHLENSQNRCYLGMLTVSPLAQNNGLGKKLLLLGEGYAQGLRCQSLYMTVISRRLELIQWYEKNGFQDTLERKPFPYGDERFGVPLVDDLEFLVLAKTL